MSKKEYAFYLDESGSPKPSLKDSAKYFAVGGVLIERQHEELIALAVHNFKERWEIRQDTPLHGNEIRSQKNHFAWLGSLPPDQKTKFLNDLTRTNRMPDHRSWLRSVTRRLFQPLPRQVRC